MVANDAKPKADGVYFLTHVVLSRYRFEDDVLVVRYRHGNVAGALKNAIGPAFGPRLDSLEGHSLVHKNLRYPELVDICAVVVLRVGDCGLDALRTGVDAAVLKFRTSSA